jgi:diaminopimelate epimerase
VVRIPFKKYEGLGNDFILLELSAGSLGADAVRRLCDRHFGIGADGVLLVGPPRTPGATATMIILNADGSQPEMCGNGIRCVAIHIAAKHGRDGAEILIDTDAGPLACKVDNAEVEVEMGKLSDLGPVEVAIEGRAHRFIRMSAGNPHAVTFERYEPSEIDVIGPLVARAPLFPEGTNVEFARLGDDGGIDLVVWERGVGRTLACGTGAAATVGAACLARRRSYGEFVPVRLPGGLLHIRVGRDTLAATMRGPARLVFEGEVTLP